MSLDLEVKLLSLKGTLYVSGVILRDSINYHVDNYKLLERRIHSEFCSKI